MLNDGMVPRGGVAHPRNRLASNKLRPVRFDGLGGVKLSARWWLSTALPLGLRHPAPIPCDGRHNETSRKRSARWGAGAQMGAKS
jgi:hypothetical protein